jgi:predicted HicB family RNase H-like nuclease
MEAMMTVLLSTCIGYAIVRFLEECVRFCINFISRLTSKKKDENLSQHRAWKSISARVSPDLHELIKTHAQAMGLTITDYILIAINEKLKRINRGQ